MNGRLWIGALVLVACAGCAGPDGDASSLREAGAATSSAPGPGAVAGDPPRWDDLVGGWRPVLPDGNRVRPIRVDGWPLTIHFRTLADGHWWDGYDGCNWSSGRIRLRPSGAFSAGAPATTLRLCGPIRDPVQWNTTAALVLGRRMVLDQGRLVILDAQDQPIASYVRSRAHR